MVRSILEVQIFRVYFGFNLNNQELMIYPILRILSVTSIYIIPAVTIMINFKKFTLLNTISFSPKLQGLHTLPVVPVKVYTNADLDKESILNENKGRAGVYC